MLKYHQIQNLLPLVCTILIIFIIFGYWKSNLFGVIGIILMLVGLLFWWLGKLTLGESFSIYPKAKKLVTNGIYTKIRNPIYTGLFLWMLGLTIYFNSLVLLIITILITISSIIRIRCEEKVLTKKFGKKYLNYKNKSWF